MRILHSADWHLGRIFHGVHLTEDQAHVLDQLVDVVAEVQPDCVIVAGDLYDRAVPPPQAVALFDDVLARLVRHARVPVLAIAGNHDSPERVDFGGRLLESAQLHVVGRLRHPLTTVRLLDETGPVNVALVPFAEPARVRDCFGGVDAPPGTPSARNLQQHGPALAHLVTRARQLCPTGERSVLVAHGSVSGTHASDSERPLWLDAGAALDPAWLDGFSYVALGHHHRPQDIGSARVRYPGSLLKYTFGEADDDKSLTLVDIAADGALTRELIPLTPRHDVRVIEGTLDDLLARPEHLGGDDGDYLKAVLTDEAPVLEPMSRLRKRYPNLLLLEQARLQDRADPSSPAAAPRERIDERLMFARFFEQMTGEDLTDAERRAFDEVMQALEAKEREAEP